MHTALNYAYIHFSVLIGNSVSKENKVLTEAEANSLAENLDQADDFSNQQINTPLITTNSLNMTHLSPKYRTINLSLGAFWGGLFLSIIFIGSRGWFFELPEEGITASYVAYGIVSFFTLWYLLHHWFADPIKTYALREHDINFESGLIFRKLVSQPLLRIQHIEIKRGPIERKAGLATLQVFSAGGISHTFVIPGLEHEHAIKLRQFILDHKDLAADV